MKIPFKKYLFFTLFLSLCTTTFINAAEIVKQDARTVYIDISAELQSPQAGDSFRIVFPGEEIINPKTGKVLGREDGESVNGIITQTKEFYAVGTIYKNAEVVGMDVQFTPKNNLQKPQTPLFPDNPATQNAGIMPLWQSNALEGRVRLIAACDLDGDKNNEVILSFKKNNEIKVLSLSPDNSLQQKAVYNIAADRHIAALDCADIKNAGKATLFVSIFDDLDNTFRVLPLNFEKGELKAETSFDGFVQGIAPYNGPRILYTQKLIKNGKRYNLTKPAPLLYQDGKYTSGKVLPIPGINSIFGFNILSLNDNKPSAAVYITKDGRLKVQFGRPTDFTLSGKENDFALSPNNFIFNGANQQLYLPLGVFRNADKTIIAAVQNNPKAENSDAEIEFFAWNGGTPQKYKTANIDGTVYDIKQAGFGPFKETLLVPYDKNGAGFLAVYAADNI